MKAAALLISMMGLAWGQRGGVAPRPAARRVIPFAGGSNNISGFTASPGSISFSATDPDLGTINGNSSASVSWTTSGPNSNKTWTLTVQAGGATFTSCTQVPVSAVTVKCLSAVTDGVSNSCNPQFTLSSSSALQVASGPEGTSTTVTIQFTFADAWKYSGAKTPPCTMNLTYTANEP